MTWVGKQTWGSKILSYSIKGTLKIDVLVFNFYCLKRGGKINGVVNEIKTYKHLTSFQSIIIIDLLAVSSVRRQLVLKGDFTEILSGIHSVPDNPIL